MTVDSLGRVYIAQGTLILQLVDDGRMSVVAGSGAAGINGDGSPAISAQLGDLGYGTGGYTRISGLAVSNGTLHFSDPTSNSIRKISDVAPLAPLVNNDVISVAKATATNIAIISNDWSRNLAIDPTSATVVAQPANGSVTLVYPTTEATMLMARYTPNAAFTGNDPFTYRVCDTTRVQCGTASVNVIVSSNEYTVAAGGLAEGAGLSVGLNPSDLARFGRYLFITDVQFQAVRRLDTYSGQLTIVAGTGLPGSAGAGAVANRSSLNDPRGLALAPDGTLMIAEMGGNTVRQVATDGTISSVAGTAAAATTGDGALATAAAVNAPQAVAFAPDGAVLTTTGNRVRKFYVGGNISSIAGGSAGGYSGDGGPATSAQLNSPRGLAVSPDGSFYIADLSNNVVRKVSTTGTITTYAGVGGAASGGDGGPATAAGLNNPRAVSLDANNNLYIAQDGANRVRKVDAVTGNISLVAGGSTSTLEGVPAVSANLPSAKSVVTGPSGDIWIAVWSQSRVRYVNSAGTITTVAGTGNPINSASGFAALQTQFNLSNVDTSIIFDSAGNMFLADVPGASIKRIDATTGIVTTHVGTGFTGNSSTQINGPQQMSFDSSGLLVFGEYGNCQVRRRNADGSLTLLAGNGACVTTPTLGGSATTTSIGHVWGAYAAPNGDLYVSDDNDYVYLVRGGVITAFAGTGTAGHNGNGRLANTAQLSDPREIAMDARGNVYFADSANHQVRMVDAAGYITGIVGTTVYGTTGDGGRATLATIAGIRGFAIDGAGNIFVGENGGNRLRKIDHATGNISTIAGTGSAGYNHNVTAAAATIGTRSGVAIYGSDLYFVETSSNKVRKVAGVASTASNALSSADWRVVPGATGHANIRERITVTPSATVTASKLTIVMPPGFAATPSTVEAYGLTGTVTGVVSGNTLVVSFPSQSLIGGVPFAIAVEGVTNGGNSSTNSSGFVTLYDGAGTTAIGWANTDVVAIATGGVPASGGPGFGSLWKRSLSATASAPSTVAVNPSATFDATGAFNISNSGTLNASSLTLSSATVTASGYTFLPVTADVSTNVTSAAFATNRWGVQITSSTGANAAATGAGVYTGVGSTAATVITGAGANNVLALTTRAKVDYLTPAGTFKGSLVYRASGGV